MSDQTCYSIIFPVLTMRKAAESNAEVVSEGLFSEAVHVLEEAGDWVNIRTLIDSYTGWVKKEGICLVKSPYALDGNVEIASVRRLSAHLYREKDTVRGPILTLPFESRLEVIDFKDDGSRWLEVVLPDSRKAYIQRGDVAVGKSLMNASQVCEFSHKFLGLPYTWGGRSSFGYDCSGYVQMLYRQMGKFLPRDSKDQFIFEGFEDKAVSDLSAGDLIFFGHSSDSIRHVGMSLGEGKFIHTSAVTENKPFLRISDVNDPEWSGTGYYPFLAGRSCLGLECGDLSPRSGQLYS